jgi:hypothetical protein
MSACAHPDDRKRLLCFRGAHGPIIGSGTQVACRADAR